MKLQNGKRRWRRILKLEGLHTAKEIKWYANVDKELQKEFYADGGRVWKHNAGWRQDSLSVFNNWKLFSRRAVY